MNQYLVGTDSTSWLAGFVYRILTNSDRYTVNTLRFANAARLKAWEVEA
jgi:hypothetical protein